MTISKNCIICNTTFEVKPSHFEKRFCCSKQCQNINQKNKKGELNNNYKGGPKKQKCTFCGKYFIPKNPYFKRKFCSRLCSSNSLKNVPASKKVLEGLEKARLIRKEKAKNNEKKICECGNKKDEKAKTCITCFHERIRQKKFKQCPNCNSLFVFKSNKAFCSKFCFSEFAKTKYLSFNNPNWKGGVKSVNQVGRYTVNYNKWRMNVFERDNYTCQKCNQKGGKLNAHHIIKWSKNKDLRFEITNGITLCKKCHKEEHLSR